MRILPLLVISWLLCSCEAEEAVTAPAPDSVPGAPGLMFPDSSHGLTDGPRPVPLDGWPGSLDGPHFPDGAGDHPDGGSPSDHGVPASDHGAPASDHGPPDGGVVVTVNVSIIGDCVYASCPAAAPYPVGCKISLAGDDCRGCVVSSPLSSKVYFQEGDKCGNGSVSGKLYCSSVPGSGLTAATCPINKKHKYYGTSKSVCPTSGGNGC